MGNIKSEMLVRHSSDSTVFGLETPSSGGKLLGIDLNHFSNTSIFSTSILDDAKTKERILTGILSFILLSVSKPKGMLLLVA